MGNNYIGKNPLDLCFFIQKKWKSCSFWGERTRDETCKKAIIAIRIFILFKMYRIKVDLMTSFFVTYALYSERKNYIIIPILGWDRNVYFKITRNSKPVYKSKKYRYLFIFKKIRFFWSFILCVVSRVKLIWHQYYIYCKFDCKIITVEILIEERSRIERYINGRVRYSRRT